MTHKDEALKLAKSWFEANTYSDEAVEVYEAIEQALAAPVQEPVAWYRDEDGIRIYYESKVWDDATPLYTTPPAAQPAPTVQEPDAHNRTLRHRIRVHIANREHYSKVEFLDKLHEILHESEQTAQPAVPDALNPKDENPAYAAGWNDCRQAMMEMMK
jgi:hypothetical protein